MNIAHVFQRETKEALTLFQFALKLGQVGTVCCCQGFGGSACKYICEEAACGAAPAPDGAVAGGSVEWPVGMREAGALMALPVSMPGPHSHPASVEKGGKDINRPSGIRVHSEE